ncbi:hypothetical protein ACQ4PT_040346 [Festuca glaucescens]
MAGGVSKEALRAILIQAMCAAKSVRVQLDHLLQLRRRLQQRIHADDDDAAVVQEVAAGLFKVYYRGLEYASRYLRSLFDIAMDNGNHACLYHLDFALALIPDEQLYGVLLAQRLPSRPTTQAQAFARVEAALHAVKLPEEHHIPRCIELLLGVRPPSVTGEPLLFRGVPGYSDDPLAAAHEHLANNGFPNPATAVAAAPPQAPSSVDLDHALTYLHRACSLVYLASKHIDLAVAVFSTSFDPKELADNAETAEKFCFIPEVPTLLALSLRIMDVLLPVQP